jgi:hypothetical protein
VVLHLAIGVAIPLVVYRIALAMFGAERPAMFAGLAFAVYPPAVGVSLAAMAETPFLLCIGLSLLFLVRAHTAPKGEGTLAACASGIFIGLASALRYEAWMLMPFMTVLFVRRPRLGIAFLAPALVHPVFWMIGNAIAHADPLYGFTWASDYERRVNGRAALASTSTSWSLRQIGMFVSAAVRHLTPLLVVLIGWGILETLRRRPRQAIWLIPPAGLFALLIAAAFHGSLAVKWRYTAVFGLLLMPYTAPAFAWLGVVRWSRMRVAVLAVALIVGVSVFTFEPLWKNVPRGRQLAAPTTLHFTGEDTALRLLPLLERGMQGGADALVSDFYGWGPTYYVALQSKLPPRDICLTAPDPRTTVDLAAVETFMLSHPQGLMVVRDPGELNAVLGSERGEPVRLGSVSLRLERLGDIEVAQTLGRTPVRALHVFRYSTLDTSAVSRSELPRAARARDVGENAC